MHYIHIHPRKWEKAIKRKISKCVTKGINNTKISHQILGLLVDNHNKMRIEKMTFLYNLYNNRSYIHKYKCISNADIFWAVFCVKQDWWRPHQDTKCKKENSERAARRIVWINYDDYDDGDFCVWRIKYRGPA